VELCSLLLKFHREEGMVLICTELSHNSIELITD